MKSLAWNSDDVFKIDITAKIFLNIDTKELNWCYLFNVRNRGRNGNGSRIIKNDFFCFAKVYYHTIMLSPVVYIGEFCCHTDIWVLWHQEGWVICKLNEFVVTRQWIQINNVGSKPLPCTKPILHDCNFETVPLANRNDPIQCWCLS